MPSTSPLRKLCAILTAAVFFVGGTPFSLAQNPINPVTQIKWQLLTGSGAPTATCPVTSQPSASRAFEGQPYLDTAHGISYTCGASAWVQQTAPALFGTGSPAQTCSSVENNGSVYTDTTDSTLYVCNGAASTWQGPFGLAGPTGPTGPTGPAGGLQNVISGIAKSAAAISNAAISYSAAPRAGYVMPPLDGFWSPVLQIATAWNSATAYTVGNQVLLGSPGSTYVALVANTNVSPTSSLGIDWALAPGQFTNLSGLSNVTVAYEDGTGTVVNTATGVAATVAGTPGTALIPLPRPLDATVPTRLNARFCIGSNTSTADTNALKVGFSNASGSASFGFLITAASMSFINGTFLSQTLANNYGFTGGIPSGTCGNMFLDWIGTGAGGLDAAGNEYVWGSFFPDVVTLLNNAFHPAFQAAYQATPVIFETTLTPAAIAGITNLYFQDASANSMLTSAFVSLGRLNGPTDCASPVPGYIAPIVLDDATQSRTFPAQVFMPPCYGDPHGNSIAEIMHPNASTNTLSSNGSMVWPNLLSGGAIVASILGDTGIGYNNAITGCSAAAGTSPFCAPDSTGWGNPTALRYRNSMVGLIRQLLPNANQLVRFCMSMGCLDAVSDEIRYPGGAGIKAYSPAWNLTGAFNLSGAAPFGTYQSFASNINNGWSNWYQSIQGGNTGNAPASSAAFWTPIGTTFTGLPLGYMSAPNFRNRGSYNATPTYNLNDLAAVPYSGSINALAQFDPYINYQGLSAIPIAASTEAQDSVVPTAWSSTLIANLVTIGNGNATNNTLGDCVAGSSSSCHLPPAVFEEGTTPPYNTTTNISPALAFFKSVNTPFPTPIGAAQPVQAVGGTVHPDNYATVTVTTGGTATPVAPCLASGCQITFAGGTLTTGAILTVAWPAGTFKRIPLCRATEQGNTSASPHGLSAPLATTTLIGTTVNAALTVASANFSIVVECN